MRWLVKGADRDSGKDVERFVDASDETAANREANKTGVLVESISPVKEVLPYASPQPKVSGAGWKVSKGIKVCAIAVVLLALLAFGFIQLTKWHTVRTKDAEIAALADNFFDALQRLKADRSAGVDYEAFTRHMADAKLASDKWCRAVSLSEFQSPVGSAMRNCLSEYSSMQSEWLSKMRYDAEWEAARTVSMLEFYHQQRMDARERVNQHEAKAESFLRFVEGARPR